MFVKRFICALLISCTLTISVSSPYYEAREVVKAAAIPVIGEIAWEVILSILISLGITVEVYDIASGNNVYQQAAEKIQDDFNGWVALDGGHESGGHQVDPELRQKEFYAVLEEGTKIAQTGQGGELVVPQDLWNSLRDWSRQRIFNEEILPELEADNARLLAFNAIERDYNSIYYPKYRILTESPSGDLTYYWLNAPVSLTAVKVWTDSFKNEYNGYYLYNANGSTCPYSIMWYSKKISGFFRGQEYSKIDFESQTRISDDRSIFGGCVIWSNYDINISYAPNVPAPNHDRDMTYRLIDSDGIGNAIASGDYDVVTAGRTYNGSEMSGDVTINIPDANTASQIVGGIMTGSQAQEELGVTPVNVAENKPLVNPAPETNPAPDIDDSIGNANKNQQQKKLKNMGLKMATLFPFCIPFDIKDSMQAMIAIQKAPVFETDIEFPSFNYTYHIKVDMSDYEKEISIFRWGMLLLFCMGLMFGTHKLIKWLDGGD